MELLNSLRDKSVKVKNIGMQRIVPLALVTTMSASVMAGCTNKKAEVTTTKITSEMSYDQYSDKEIDLLSFDEYLEISDSKKQKEAISMMKNYIEYFNGDFADTYVEEGNVVKVALNWEYEVPALAIAYNGYSSDEIKEILVPSINTV